MSFVITSQITPLIPHGIHGDMNLSQENFNLIKKKIKLSKTSFKTREHQGGNPATVSFLCSSLFFLVLKKVRQARGTLNKIGKSLLSITQETSIPSSKTSVRQPYVSAQLASSTAYCLYESVVTHDMLREPCSNYLEYIDQWYPLPEVIFDELRNYIVDYAFDPTRDPW